MELVAATANIQLHEQHPRTRKISHAFGGANLEVLLEIGWKGEVIEPE